MSNTVILLSFLICTGTNIVNCEKILDGGYIKTCPRPTPPKNSVISFIAAPRFYPNNKQYGGFGVDAYQEHDKMYFQCKEGYSQPTSLYYNRNILYIRCGSDGKWFPEIENLGKCIKNTHYHKCTKGLFKCKKSKRCIAATKRCDCIVNCKDGSDEIGCPVRRRVIHAGIKGTDSAGIIQSPLYPRGYPKNFTCMYHIRTMKGHHIEILFEEFKIAEKVKDKCIDSFKMIGIHPKFTTKNSILEVNNGKSKIYSETRCGKNKFDRTFSDLPHISLNVSLGHDPKQPNARGFAFFWYVRSDSYFENHLSQMKGKEYTYIPNPVTTSDSLPLPNAPSIENQEKIKESTYTILTPIAISALLPLSLITFLCCQRQLRHKCKKHSKEDKKEPTVEKVEVTDSQQTLTLTENNLALFEHRMQCQGSGDNQEEGKPMLNLAESDENSRKNHVNSVQSCDCRCCLSNSRNSHMRQECIDKLNCDSYSSHQSETPRYVMSYDVPLRQSPVLNTVRHEPATHRHSPCASPDLRGSPSRLSKPYNSSSPRLQNSLPSRGRTTKCSRENLRHSYNSQVTNSCKLCSHHRSLKKLERNCQNNQIDGIRFVMDSLKESEDFHEYPVDHYPENFYSSSEEFLPSPYVNETYTHESLSYKNSVEIYNQNGYPYCNGNRHSNLNPNDSLSYNEKHFPQTRIMYIENTYDQEQFVNTVAYDKRPPDFYTIHKFDGTNRTRGGSIVCTH